MFSGDLYIQFRYYNMRSVDDSGLHCMRMDEWMQFLTVSAMLLQFLNK